MNRAQHVALSCGFVCLLLAGCLPPWRGTSFANHSDPPFSVNRSVGFGPLWSPPQEPGVQVRIDAGLLLANITIVSGVTGLVVILLGVGWVQRFLWPLDHP